MPWPSAFLPFEVYFSIDPVTFGPREEQSLEMEEFEPLNAPSMLSSSSSRKLSHQKSGSRLLSHVQSGGSAAAWRCARCA